MEKIKALADELEAIQQPVSQKDIIFYALDGLGINYDSLITLVTTSLELPSFEALYSILLNRKKRLEQYHSSTNENIRSAFFTIRDCSRGNRVRDRDQGGGRGHDTQTLQVIYNKAGHNVLHCLQRYNFTYALDFPAAFFAMNLSTDPYDSTWYPDIAATNHMIENASSIMHPSPYTGQEPIVVANGKTLLINSTGTTYLHTPLSNFLLRDTLHVPHL
ncbi:hypothetical protein AMTR_s00070p00072810 [Amborella trichopoda]|uniref:Reverse transcriptase Ty1/copia-type domain-containing protein n=1 Tax=Amborella trichopoda TaxID=13333 RepID=U5DDH6_AMBTC|nr:hypothetical protein AMTR_s00070p00072810 [Amborella trichopoda]